MVEKAKIRGSRVNVINVAVATAEAAVARVDFAAAYFLLSLLNL